MKRCPFCSEFIKDEALKCRYCGEWLNEPPVDSPYSQQTVRKNYSNNSEPPTIEPDKPLQNVINCPLCGISKQTDSNRCDCGFDFRKSSKEPERTINGDSKAFGAKPETKKTAIPNKEPQLENRINEEKLIVRNDKITDYTDPRYDTVGGWLSLACFGLVFLNPFFNFPSLISQYVQMDPLYYLYPRLRIINLVNLVLGIGIILFGMYAGAMLYMLKKNAPNIAKKCLLALFGYTIFKYPLFLMAGLPSEAYAVLSIEMLAPLIKQAIIVSVWYAYFVMSKRVKRTYFREYL